MRYEFDNGEITITRDASRDEFGLDGVTAERCAGVAGTGGLPEGVDCRVASSDGFRSDSLP